MSDDAIKLPVDVSCILHLLPHRYPFLLVDRVVELEAHKRIRAIKNVTFNEPYFQGHFPGRPVMPGVLVIEALARLRRPEVLQEIERARALERAVLPAPKFHQSVQSPRMVGSVSAGCARTRSKNSLIVPMRSLMPPLSALPALKRWPVRRARSTAPVRWLARSSWSPMRPTRAIPTARSISS